MSNTLILHEDMQRQVTDEARRWGLSPQEMLDTLLTQGLAQQGLAPPAAAAPRARRGKSLLSDPQEQERLRGLLLQAIQEAEEDDRRESDHAAPHAERPRFEGPYGQAIREKYRRQGFDV